MKVRLSEARRGLIGVCGHAGVGHIHSHSGFVQDDSGGLAVAATLLREALPVDCTIAAVEADLEEGWVTVTTADGGRGRARARRGITPYEAELLQRAVGRDARFTQAAAFAALGRIYGQGVLEAPVALQAAVALALLDTFEKKWPAKVRAVPEDLPGSIGRALGAVLDFGGTPVALLAVVNASEGGLGPVEDLEGNVGLGAKGRLMKELGLDSAPTIVVEGKPFVPSVCGQLAENTLWIRANRQSDNLTVASCLAEAAAALAQAHLVSDTAFPRGGGDLAAATRALGRQIADLGQRLAAAGDSLQKVLLVGDLARLISQDAGGATFMSDSLQNVVGSAGMVPGTSAVISLLVTPEYIRHWKIPVFTEEDAGRFTAVIRGAVEKLGSRLERAREEAQAKRNFNEQDFAFLFANHPPTGSAG